MTVRDLPADAELVRTHVDYGSPGAAAAWEHMQARVPGHEAAPWGWDEDDLDKAVRERGRALLGGSPRGRSGERRS